MTNPNDGAPLTRRQLRELAAAQAAGQSAAPAGEGPTPQAPPAAPTAPAAQQVAPASPQVPARQAAPARSDAPARPATQPMRTRSIPTPVNPSDGVTPAGPGAGTQAPLASRRSAIPGLVPDAAESPVPRTSHPSGPPAAAGPSAPSAASASSRPSAASGTPSPVRPASAAGQAGAPSRRSLREQTASHRVVVVPPAQSSAIRTIDETGELSAVLDLGAGGPAASERHQPARPADASSRPQRQPAQQRPAQRQPAQQAPAQQGPPQKAPVQHGTPQPSAIQRVSTPGVAGQQQAGEAQQAHWSAGPGITPAPARPQTVVPQRPAATGAGAPVVQPGATAAGKVPAAWPPMDKPWAPQEGMRPAAPLAEAGATSFSPRVTAPGFEPVPALPVPATQVPVAEQAVAIPQWQAITTPSPAPARSADAVHDDDDDFDDDFDDDDEPDHKYTWLHYLILVAVAFVLGLIIWKVGLEDRGAASPADSAASVGVVFDAPSTPYDHYL